MAELVILNIPSDLSERMHRLAQAGDEAAERWFQELWSEYAGPFECFCFYAVPRSRNRDA